MKNSIMINLNDFKKNKYSQNGEDGVLEKIFIELDIVEGLFCEFGAWDGIHLSNTYALYERGWSGIYIEGNEERFKDLTKNITNTNSILICDYVQVTGDKSLDNLLNLSGIFSSGRQLDLMSIDIDSDDLSVLKSLKNYRPTVLVVEYNPTIPLDVDYINPQSENKGNSARSIVNYATSQKYILISVTDTNLIFITAEKKPITIRGFDLNDVEIFPIIRYFWGYDGTLMFCQHEQVQTQEILSVPWTSAFFHQPIPQSMRKFNHGSLLKVLHISFSTLNVSLFSMPSFIKKIFTVLKKHYISWRASWD